MQLLYEFQHMKKSLIILFVSLFISLAGSAQVKRFQDLTGRWAIAGQDAGAYLEVIDSSNIYLNYMGEKKKIISYSMDLSKSPSWFDFTVPDSIGVLHIKSLVQVFGDNTMKWQLFLDEERTPHFTATRGELMYLKKVSAGVAAPIAKTQ